MNKNKHYSVYKSGLNVGDLVNYKYHVFGKGKCSGYLLSSVVLKRKHLFDQDTRWGIKGFFEYEMMNIDAKNSSTNNRVFFTVKTQNITIKNVKSAN